jgi:hypothetical protein
MDMNKNYTSGAWYHSKYRRFDKKRGEEGYKNKKESMFAHIYL